MSVEIIVIFLQRASPFY